MHLVQLVKKSTQLTGVKGGSRMSQELTRDLRAHPEDELGTGGIEVGLERHPLSEHDPG